MNAPAQERRRSLLAAALLALATCLVFSPALGHGFLTLDDGSYVYANRHVRPGLSWENVQWAFTRAHSSNWHPLTWLSHMLDIELFGMDAGGHHGTSVVLHGANAALLLLALRAMGLALPTSLFVSAVFALHPLRAESVAWVAERKDVLAGLFWMLTLLAWTAYARRPGPLRYLLAAACFALGLMAKPMLVTLPFVLLLVDLWPLGRWPQSDGERDGRVDTAPAFPPATPARLALEKLPLLALSALSAWVTSVVQTSAMRPELQLDYPERFANAALSVWTYVGQTLWPVGLSPFYPHPALVSPESFHALSPAALLAALAIALASLGALAAWRRRPWWTTGWFWTLGTLVPVIGIVQVGEQAHADRYTYLPLIGVVLALAHAAARTARARPRWRAPVALAACALPLALAPLTWRQVEHWSDSRSLFRHALAVTEKNYVAHFNLGVTLEDDDPEGAIREYERALAIRPDALDARYNLGSVLLEVGRLEPAADQLERCLRMRPGLLAARVNLGIVLARLGRNEEATEHLERAVRERPESAEAHSNLAGLYASDGDLAAAVRHYRLALDARSNLFHVRLKLVHALLALERPGEAADELRAAARQRPDDPEVARLRARLAGGGR